MFKIIKTILLAVLIITAAYAIYAQASTGTHPYPIRGAGQGEISGYTISHLHFRLAENPRFIRAVEFDLDRPASEVLVQFDSPSNLSFSCNNPAGTHWVCALEGVKTGEVTEIQISASG